MKAYSLTEDWGGEVLNHVIDRLGHVCNHKVLEEISKLDVQHRYNANNVVVA